MKVIIGFLFIGWLLNICENIIVWIFECIEEKDWLCLALPFITITLSIFITWLLYHFGIYDDNLVLNGQFINGY